MRSRLLDAVGWRAGHVVGKLTGTRPHVPWQILWREVAARHELAFESPRFETVETSSEEGLVRMVSAGVSYWVPEHTHEGSMQQIYKEVYNPAHPHYYELGGCRLREGDVVLDGGACEGIFVRYALDRGAKVIAVEPWSRMCMALERSFSREVAEGRLTVVQGLLSDREGTSTLVLHPRFPFEACEGWSDDEGLIKEQVPVTTIDRVVEASPWKRCDFLKLDIEGSERPAMQSALRTVREFRPRIAIAVYHRPDGYVAIRGDLQALGMGYHVEGKGLQLAEGGWRPMLLHAWIP